MQFGGPVFVISIIALSMIGWIATTWIRARHGYPIENEWTGMTEKPNLDADRRVTLLTQENERLTGQVSRLEERIAVLERIATDPAERLGRDIDALR
jgi:acetolactate synthase small subunit